MTAVRGVALDIGPGRGALILRTAPGRSGEEIEVARRADGWRTHVAVREHRTAAGGVVHAAVFGSLPEGRYSISGDLHPGGVRIREGSVTDIGEG
jgi:hypothetical protein